MKTNKGSLLLIVSIIIALAALGGGAMYYKNNLKTSSDSVNENEVEKNTNSNSTGDIVKSNILATTPKQLFLDRNTEMYNTQSFDAMLSVSRKYDAPSKIQEDVGQFQNATNEQKQKNFTFSKGFFNPTDKLINITEVINEGNATVTAFDGKGDKIVAIYGTYNGEWRLQSIKTILTGTNQ